MSSKSRLWQYLLVKGEATNAQIADFMRGSKGQLSWGQRIRELRKELIAKGGSLECSEIKRGIYLYKVIPPEPPQTEHEEIIAHSNLGQEKKINRESVQREFVLR